MRRLAQAALTLATITILLLVAMSPASAHVLLDSAQPRGDGSVDLTFSFDHSCTDSPTTRLIVTVPSGSRIEAASQPEGWTSEVEGDTVSWTGRGTETSTGRAFTITARLQGEPGSPLLFPTRQDCDNGDGYDWNETAEDGNRPAPRLIATQAVLDPALTPTPSQPAGEQTDHGATTVQIAIALAVFSLVAAAGVSLSRRRA